MPKLSEKRPVITEFHAELRWDLQRGPDETFEEFEATIASLRDALKELCPTTIKLYRVFPD